MSSDGLSDDEIRRILGMKNVVVVGISRNVGKPAHLVPAYLRSKNYIIIPVNPFAERVFGIKTYESLSEVKEPIDIVDIFRPSQDVPKIVEEAVKKGVKVVWMQKGISNDEAARNAREHGLTVVWNRCMMKEHKRLFGRQDEKPFKLK